MMFIWMILVCDMKMAYGHGFWYHLIGHKTEECEIWLVCLWIHFDCWAHYDWYMDFEALCDWSINLLNESCKWKIWCWMIMNWGIGCLWCQCMWLGIFVIYVCRTRSVGRDFVAQRSHDEDTFPISLHLCCTFIAQRKCDQRTPSLSKHFYFSPSSHWFERSISP